MTKMEIIKKIKELVELDKNSDAYREKWELSTEERFYAAYHGYVSLALESLLEKAQED